MSIIMSFTRSSEKEFLEKITQIVGDNLKEEQFGVSELAREMGMARTSLHRRVKSISGASASQFIRGIRLTRAMDLLRETSLPISEVAFECGFHSVSYFTTCFHDYYGYPPSKAGSGETEVPNEENLLNQNAKPGLSRKQLKIALFGTALFVILVILLLIIIQPHIYKKQSLEKSLAVLPFVNDSPDQENTYFINGLMDDLTTRLQTIKDLRVPGRPSVENYRNTTRSIPEIAEALNVSYVLVGSGQKYGNHFKLRVQLIEGARDKQLWAASYEEQIGKPEDIYRIQSQITQSIAKELEAIITQDEKQLIEKIPTTNQTALEFYLKGEEERGKYNISGSNREALRTAEYLYFTALEYDSTFAQVYVSLAWLYINIGQFESILSDDYLDSAQVLANMALRYDNQLASAYIFKGYCFTRQGKPSQAIMEFNSAIKLNPNHQYTYHSRAMLYYFNNDLVRAIIDWHKAISLNADPESNLRFSVRELRMLGINYYQAGFHEKAVYYIDKALVLEKDSARHYGSLYRVGGYNNTLRSAIEAGEKAISLGLPPLAEVRISRILGQKCLFAGRNEEALKYFERSIEVNQSVGVPLDMCSSIGFAYWIQGSRDKAEYYFNEQIRFSNSIVELDRESKNKYEAFYYLSGAYACMGLKDKAYEQLNKFNQQQRMSLKEVSWINNDPIFDNIRDEPEFQQIVRDVEAKYQIEHERVRKWLEENDML